MFIIKNNPITCTPTSILVDNTTFIVGGYVEKPTIRDFDDNELAVKFKLAFKYDNLPLVNGTNTTEDFSLEVAEGYYAQLDDSRETKGYKRGITPALALYWLINKFNVKHTGGYHGFQNGDGWKFWLTNEIDIYNPTGDSWSYLPELTFSGVSPSTFSYSYFAKKPMTLTITRASDKAEGIDLFKYLANEDEDKLTIHSCGTMKVYS